ncbi:sugar phosphate isomerase/epimerase family protein [Adhaeribacter radiodurans]|uniref:Sugar phosphate isomerase/epimerase n=1 Tax=Adhaeribacter radiodurans TaxID=2745197 RepID=A0A7L7LEA2_9BACT|nr:sugar phosphate isomerase/epimerase [Adhaeribacter radiodurans]QMU31140.1 sugar phosphate isomerase/epimerase [Adhaeribacter radiodurans]
MKKLVLSAFTVLCLTVSCKNNQSNDASTSASGSASDSAATATSATTTSSQSNPEEKLDWKLGAQAYTFNRFTFAEAIDKIKSCGLSYVEAFPGQTIGGGIEGKMEPNMSAEKRNQILKMLQDKGVKMVSFGVTGAKDEAGWRELFQFAKDMGLENITMEPEPEFVPLVSKLCDEYGINAAIHNHPTPSRYWNPDVVIAAMKGQSKRLGACADIGHWVRSGLDPVECLKKLDGHIIQLHFKDLNEKSKDAHDVHWGQGVSNVDGVLAELKRQNFKGLFSAEYEYNWENSAPDVTASVQYFREAVQKLEK